jgi:hypothetical protein
MELIFFLAAITFSFFAGFFGAMMLYEKEPETRSAISDAGVSHQETNP